MAGCDSDVEIEIDGFGAVANIKTKLTDDIHAIQSSHNIDYELLRTKQQQLAQITGMDEKLNFVVAAIENNRVNGFGKKVKRETDADDEIATALYDESKIVASAEHANADPHDICLICCSVVTLPVLPAQQCHCTQTVCLYCFGKYVGLHDLKKTRLPKKSLKCLICHMALKKAPISALCNLLPRHMIVELDRKYPTVTCQFCNSWTGSRIELMDKHMNVCELAIVECQSCNKPVTNKMHIIKCDGCDAVMPSCKMQEHQANCENVTRCDFCGNALITHKYGDCEFCHTHITICGGSTLEDHYENCPFAYWWNNKWYSTANPGEFCNRCIRCNRWVPNNAAQAHNSICITLMSE